MKKVLLRSLLVTAVAACLAYFYGTLPEVNDLRTKNPKSTALMELRDQEYRQKGGESLRQQVWVPYAAISEHLKKAVLISEDAAFFSHTGVDVNELQEALKKDWETGSFARGGSTITMQLAKNLYGVEAASRRYFAKSAAHLDIHEAATLAAMLPNPRNPRASTLVRKRNLILSRMAGVGYLTAEEFNRAKQTPIPTKAVVTSPLPPASR